MEAWKLRNWIKIIFNNEPYKVVKYLLRPSSRGAAKMVTKLQNLLRWGNVEKTFPSTENIEEADIEMWKAQYLYNNWNDYVFMDNESFEQFEFEKEKLWNIVNFLKDDLQVSIMKWNWNAINIDLPPTINFKIIEAEPWVKWDTASSANKKAKIETGAEILVPLFIEAGEMVVINTETWEYKERVK